ncbi:basic-leucine zipper transcription factor [Heterobasidion irregulare TC 32-1]|uniref:Basic-leucine zipper transcription factor n=1 Tax=Heterobasidion irregulare (strain TC 32-1) TaxID=747525 RepID=W4K7R0_HETIT|nr:basic-leucine zipper transcription factor [Heterobasidion irregulare TC 32-1]ETW81390.1 basic-leucine zipper transcription factor [Heterobasidion irregulare TC 32-1]
MSSDAQFNDFHTFQPSANAQADSLHTLRPQTVDEVTPQPLAIPASPLNNFIYPNQDVRPLPVNRFPDSYSSSRSHAHPLLESQQLSTLLPSHHGDVNHPSHRPRTYNQVFHTTSDLAAHHGIPQQLPPPPRTTPRRLPVSENSIDSPRAFDFLCSNYLTMLAPQSADLSVPSLDSRGPAAGTRSDMPVHDDDAAAQAVLSVIQASPDFETFDAFEPMNYLTSPGESPMDDMLTTPALGDDFMSPDVWTSPMLEMGGDFDMSLFPDTPGYLYDAKPLAPVSSSLPPVFDTMYTMPSPDTPALDPSSLHSPSGGTSVTSQSSIKQKRKQAPTGTRKNLTPDSLVPVDAPIQPRKYVMPSQTSRKELPATFARKRARSQAFGEDDGDDVADGPTLSEEDAIKAKRLQNTLAARRSRKRKLEYQRELEDALEAERQDKEMWKARALVLEALLMDKGHHVPPINDS